MAVPDTPTAVMCPLRVLLLWALLCPGTGKFQEILTWQGSDLLIPIRQDFTLNYPFTGRCDRIDWNYKDPTRDIDTTRFVQSRGCRQGINDNQLSPNTRISGDGSLIISNVTLENDGIYSVDIFNSTGHHIQEKCYIIHVEGKFPEEIFTRPGSDLLISIQSHLTLNHPDTERCDDIYWLYQSPGHDYTIIFIHSGCTLRESEDKLFSNMRISENGSLIISNVTLENDGRYSVVIHNSTGLYSHRDYYTVHVEVPVSVPDLNVSCLWNGSAEISCRAEEGTNPNIRLSVIGGFQEEYSDSANNITAIVESPGPWNITCTVENGVSRLGESRAGVTCPAPLSDITVSISCLPNGSAVAVCLVKGSDPHYSWSLDGRSVSSDSWITLPPPISGTLHCDVTNQINNLSRAINISCAVSLSDITVSSYCLPDGRAVAVCLVKGSDPHYSWSLDGRSVSSDSWITLPPQVSGTLHCDVTNQINNLSRSINISCAENTSH